MYGMSDALYETERDVADLRKLVKIAKAEILTKVATSELPVDERIRLIALLNEID